MTAPTPAPRPNAKRRTQKQMQKAGVPAALLSKILVEY